MIHSLLTNSFLASTSIRCRQGLQQKFDVMQQAVVEINGISGFRRLLDRSKNHDFHLVSRESLYSQAYSNFSLICHLRIFHQG